MRDIFIDCEFIRDDLTPYGLVSIALSSGEDFYYAVNADMDVSSLQQDKWMVDNVWKHLPSKRRFILDRSHPDVKRIPRIRDDIHEWFESLSNTGDANKDFKLHAWYGGQDIVRLQGLWIHDWVRMPCAIPRYLHDIQEDLVDAGVDDEDLPTQDPNTVHHALHDARHDEVIFQFLREK